MCKWNSVTSYSDKRTAEELCHTLPRPLYDNLSDVTCKELLVTKTAEHHFSSNIALGGF